MWAPHLAHTGGLHRIRNLQSSGSRKMRARTLGLAPNIGHFSTETRSGGRFRDADIRHPTRQRLSDHCDRGVCGVRTHALGGAG